MTKKPTYEELEKRVEEFDQAESERKQAAEALRESEARYLNLFENMLEGLAYCQMLYKDGRPDDFIYLDVNKMFGELTGLQNVVGKRVTEVIPRIKEVTPELFGIYARVVETGNPEQFELNFTPLDIWLNISVYSSGKGYFVAVFENITERKQAEEALRESEEKYRNIFENAVEGFFQSTPKGRFISVNPAFAKMLGYASPEELIANISDIATQYYVNPEDRRRYQQLLRKAGIVENFEFKAKRKDGSQIWVSNSTRACFDKDGRVDCYEGIVLDITDRIQAEKQRRKLEDQLQQAHKMEAIGTLAGGIAHDFNNILTPIMIHSEMAKMELPHDSPVQHNLKEIFKAGARATDMVKQILTFSRKKEGERALIKISPVLKDVLKMLRSTIPTTIDIKQNLEAESDTVLADPTQVHQILLNLGTNAAHAMREKGGALKVSLVQEDLDSEATAKYSDLNPGPYLKLTVSDTGSGIDDETMQKIFEPYFTTKGPGEGTGMGLALIHGIVKSYAGDITVESEPGKGTTFNVYIPRVEADVSPVEEPSVQIPRGTESILFVDDEKVTVDAIQPMLENLGYKVTARTSSIEALEAFKNDPNGFDIVITDMTMPNMTGKDLAKEIISIRSDIPIILCTGFSEQIDEEKAKEMGISFVMKPIVLSQIANTIRKVLDHGD